MPLSTKNTFFTAIFFLFIACASPDNEKENAKYPQTLQRTKRISFALDQTASFSPYTLQYLDDGQRAYLLASNKNTLTVDVYEAATNKLVAKLGVNDSLTKYTDNLHAFWAINQDSILVYSQFKFAFVLLKVKDWRVQARFTFRPLNPRTQQPMLNHGSQTALPSFVLDNKVHFAELPLADIAKLIGTGYQLEHAYDLGRDTTTLVNTTWPKAYLGGYWDDLFTYYWTFDSQKRIIYSWQAEHDLLVREGDSLRRVPARSDRFTTDVEYDPSLKNLRGDDVNFIEQNYYGKVLYDRYRKCYYRFASIGVPSGLPSGEIKSYDDRPFVVITLDKNFRKIAEDYFPPGRYLPKDSFVSREGLCISDHNLRNYDKVSEDEMSFSVFELNPKQ
jgi:Domain of unknown function (DUF4221)